MTLACLLIATLVVDDPRFGLDADQLRTVDTARLVKKLGRLRGKTTERVIAVLSEMFAP